MTERFEQMLTGGHPNSLGRTVEVVDLVMANPDRFGELFACYQSEDAVVRLRTSNAMKRVEGVRPDLLIPYLDRFLDEVTQLDQASAQWTLATLFRRLSNELTEAQLAKAKQHTKDLLATHTDWIVLNEAIQTLCPWAKTDPELFDWLRPHLQRLSQDKRKSVAKRAQKHFAHLYGDRT